MSKIKVLVTCVPGGNPLLGPDSCLLAVSSHAMGKGEGGKQRENEGKRGSSQMVLLIKARIPS